MTPKWNSGIPSLPDFGAPENKKIPFPSHFLEVPPPLWHSGVADSGSGCDGSKGNLLDRGGKGGGREGSYYSISLALCQSVGGWVPFYFYFSGFNFQLTPGVQAG